MNLEDLISPKYKDMFLDPEFQSSMTIFLKYLIKNDKEYRAEIKTYFDECTAVSELKPIKRIAKLETITGINDYANFEDENREPNIPEQISALSERIDKIASSTHESVTPKQPDNIIPETKTEARAVFLVEYLNKEVKERNGEHFLNGNEIKDFLTRIIPERYNPDFGIKEGQNLRKIKKDVLEKAKKLFPGKIWIIPNKHGRKETRILFRPLPTVT